MCIADGLLSYALHMTSISSRIVHHYLVFNRGISRHQPSLKIWLCHFMNCLCSRNVIQGIQSKNKFNTNEVFVKFKIYPKWKPCMSIPLCKFIVMLSNLFLKWPFKWVIGRGERSYLFSPTNWQGEDIVNVVSLVESSWGPL